MSTNNDESPQNAEYSHYVLQRQDSATMDTQQNHFKRVLEYDNRGIRLTEENNLPNISHYIQVLPAAVPHDLSSLTHVDQLVLALSDAQRIILTTTSLEFGIFLDTELTDLRQGVNKDEVHPLIIAKVLILASIFRLSNLYSVKQHAAKLVEMAEWARLVTLAQPLVTVPYVDTMVGTISQEGDRCPICWESHKLAAADYGDLLDDLDCEEVQLARTRCGHIMCLECLESWANESTTCPVCRGLL